MRTVPVRPHNRRLPEKPSILDNAKSQQLWNEFVGNVLAMELDHVLLPEPLDDPQFDDMDEETKRRVREAG